MDKYDVAEIIFKLALGCFFIVAFIGLFIGVKMMFGSMNALSRAADEREEKLWNNGICPECNVRYEYRDSVTSSGVMPIYGYGYFYSFGVPTSDTDYIYECPKCHKIIKRETLDNK